MKKFKALLSIILVALTIFTASSCSLFYNPIKDNESKSTTITIYDGDLASEFEVEYGKQAEITAFTKKGYYLSGYYTEPNGGEKYFDVLGKSTQIWQKGLPEVFYAHWIPISEIFYSEEKRIEDPKTWTGYDFPGFVFELTPETQNAIAGNLDKKVEITYSFDLKDTSNYKYSDMKFYLSNGLDSGRENFVSETITTQSNYENYSGSTTTTAKKFLNNGKVCMSFKKTYGAYDYYAVKNLKITFKFVE